MAKLKAPLLSLGAAGAIGKTLVFFGWKGINAVREYVVPSNPKTALQLTQRGYVTDAVAMVHTAQARAVNPLDSDDQVAYSALAAAKGKIMTWFNQAVKLWVDVAVADKTSVVYSAGQNTTFEKDDFRLLVAFNEETPSDLAAGTFYLGTSKTNLIQSETAVITVGSHAALPAAAGFSGLTAGVKYYWQFRPDAGDPCEGADSGIYSGVAV